MQFNADGVDGRFSVWTVNYRIPILFLFSAVDDLIHFQ